MGARETRQIIGILTVVGMLVFATTATGSNSVTYQIDAQHDGHIEGANLDPPYHRLWQRQFQTAVSYPLIVGNRVFVAVAKPSSDGTILYALSRTTGKILWTYSLGGQRPWSGIAFGGGRLYAITSLGFLRAFDPATGDVIWLRHVPGSSFSSAPTYRDGLLYVDGDGPGGGGSLHAVTRDGDIAWSQHNPYGADESSPAVGKDRVFVSYSGPQIYAFDKTTGDPAWHYDSGFHGGGGRTPVLHEGRLYARDNGVAYVFDVTDGSLIDTFDVGPAPAFAGDRGYRVVEGRRVESWDLNTGFTRWFVGDPYRGVGGAFTSAPLVLNDEVIQGSVEGNVYGIKGKVNWQDAVGQPIYGPNEQDSTQLLTGLAAGQGTLVVPANTKLVAYSGS
jgi:outer membrane protein assembly factor BamB